MTMSREDILRLADEVHGRVVAIDYTNYKGERSSRLILPLALTFTTCQWHPGQQWLLESIDLEKQALRTFALKDIHSWAPVGSREEKEGG